MIFLEDDAWEIRETATKGNGLFATKDLPCGIVVGDYIGRVLNTAQDDISAADQRYLMYYSDKASLLPTDVQQPGVHLINHSCDPNCWIFVYRGHTLFFTLRHIFTGEELTIAYLLSPRDEFCSPCTHQCLCDSTACAKTMHLTTDRYREWRLFADMQAKKTKRAAIRYGKTLPLLSSYPECVPDQGVYRLTGCRNKPALIRDDAVMPSVQEIRQSIRQTGRILDFPKVQTTIIGVENGQLILV